MKKFRRDSRGFSLIELLIIVAMIGAVSAIAFPSLFKQVPRWRANSVTNDVSGKLMIARLRAIQNNKTYAIEFSFGDRDSFKLKVFNNGAWEDDGFESWTPSDVNIELGGTCNDDRVVFNTNGTAEGNCNPVKVITRDTSQSRELAINTSTGKITVKNCNLGECT